MEQDIEIKTTCNMPEQGRSLLSLCNFFSSTKCNTNAHIYILLS